jgi:hypothetical protein
MNLYRGLISGGLLVSSLGLCFPLLFPLFSVYPLVCFCSGFFPFVFLFAASQ